MIKFKSLYDFLNDEEAEWTYLDYYTFQHRRKSLFKKFMDLFLLRGKPFEVLLGKEATLISKDHKVSIITESWATWDVKNQQYKYTRPIFKIKNNLKEKETWGKKVISNNWLAGWNKKENKWDEFKGYVLNEDDVLGLICHYSPREFTIPKLKNIYPPSCVESAILATAYCDKKSKNNKQIDIVSYIVSLLKQTTDE